MLQMQQTLTTGPSTLCHGLPAGAGHHSEMAALRAACHRHAGCGKGCLQALQHPHTPSMQVLGNAELRQRYDQHGAEGLDVNFMDGAEFFTMLFGSDSFEHLLGELMIAAAARCASWAIGTVPEECWGQYKGRRLARHLKGQVQHVSKLQACIGSAWQRAILELP